MTAERVETLHGFMIITEDEVADGHLRVVSEYQYIEMAGSPAAGAIVTSRTAYLNGMLVTSPDWARQLREEARQHGTQA